MRTGNDGNKLRPARYAALQLWEDRHRGFKRAGRPGRSAGYPAGRVRPPIGPMCFPIVRAIALPNVIVGSRPTVSCRCMFLCTGGVRAVWDCRSKTHLFVLGDNRAEHTTFPSGRPPVISGRPLPPGGEGGDLLVGLSIPSCSRIRPARLGGRGGFVIKLY